MLVFYLVLVITVLYVCFWLSVHPANEQALPPPSTPRASWSGPAGGGIRLLTLNAFMRPAPISHAPTHGGDNKSARLAAIMHILPQYDVVCFQEMWELYDRAAFCGQFPFSARSPSALGKSDGGLLILSRLPITRAAFTPLSEHATFPDTLVNKGFLTARIDVGGGAEITVVNAHLQASYSEQEDASAQLAQLRTVRAKVAREPNLVLCGDFNLDALESRVRARVRRVLHPLKDMAPMQPTITCVYDAFTGQELCTTRRMCPTCQLHYPPASDRQYSVRHRRLDFLCAAPSVHVGYCTILPDIVSDHCAIAARIQLSLPHHTNTPPAGTKQQCRAWPFEPLPVGFGKRRV